MYGWKQLETNELSVHSRQDIKESSPPRTILMGDAHASKRRTLITQVAASFQTSRTSVAMRLRVCMCACRHARMRI